MTCDSKINLYTNDQCYQAMLILTCTVDIPYSFIISITYTVKSSICVMAAGMGSTVICWRKKTFVNIWNKFEHLKSFYIKAVFLCYFSNIHLIYLSNLFFSVILYKFKFKIHKTQKNVPPGGVFISFLASLELLATISIIIQNFSYVPRTIVLNFHKYW
jgi:hypothetical protein